jgi:hypothetical protein
MEAYSVETAVLPDGTVRLEGVPVRAGERVQVIVLAAVRPRDGVDSSSLRGSVLAFERPTDPVAESDWEANGSSCWIPTYGSGGSMAVNV